MLGYKTLKAKSKVIVRNKKVIDRQEIAEIVDEDQKVIRSHQPEQTHHELQIVSKRFDPSTGEALEDQVQRIDLKSVESQLKSKKEEKARIDSEVADFETLLADLNKINIAGDK